MDLEENKFGSAQIEPETKEVQDTFARSFFSHFQHFKLLFIHRNKFLKPQENKEQISTTKLTFQMLCSSLDPAFMRKITEP